MLMILIRGGGDLKADERKKKFVLGLVMYTLGIGTYSVMVSLSVISQIWFLAFLGVIPYLPLAVIGLNLMLRHRWW